ncbi:MAG: flagellin [Pseudomonadota bacterium]
MTLTSLGDLSSSYSTRLRNVSLRQEIDRLTQELATGQITNVREVLAGNTGYLTDLERRMDVLEGFKVATTEAAVFGRAIQDSLEIFERYGEDLSSSLLIAGTNSVGVISSDTVLEAKSALSGLIGTLNTNAAGRFLFSGVATDRPPLLDADTLLTELRTVIGAAAATDPDSVLAAAEAWFNDPAGFEAMMYQGGARGLAPINLSETEQVTLDVRATDPELREVLRLTAVAALADDPTLGYDAEGQSELFAKTGSALLLAQDDVIAVRANVGFAEAQVQRIAARNAAEQTGLEYAKLELLNVDPFEAATRLEEAQFQLQSLYQVTVRMSQLSLSNFL